MENMQTVEQLKDFIKEYLQNHLTIQITSHYSNYGDEKFHKVSLCLDGEVFSEEYVD